MAKTSGQFGHSRFSVFSLLLEFGKDLLEVFSRFGVFRAALGTALAQLLLLDPLLKKLLVSVGQIFLADALRLFLALKMQSEALPEQLVTKQKN